MTRFALSGTTALVTGASSGIGRALARALAEEGARVVLTARRADRLELLAGELVAEGFARPTVVPGDLGAPGGPEAIFAAARAAAGPIEVLVANAGVGRYGPAHRTDHAAAAAILRVNVEALVRLTLLALPEMIERRSGAILHVASVVGFVPFPYMAIYGATKSFVVSFSQAVHAEAKRHGVHVACLCPGRTATEFLDVAGYPRRARNLRAAPGMSAEAVAREGIAALTGGGALRTAGRMNRLIVAALRLLPRRLLLPAAERLMRP